MAKGKFQLQQLRQARVARIRELAEFVINFLHTVPLVTHDTTTTLFNRIKAVVDTNEELAASEREYYEEWFQRLEKRIEELEGDTYELNWHDQNRS